MDRVSYRTFIEVDMHGREYRLDEWITVIRMALDDASDLGVDAVDFIAGQGLHSVGDPVLRKVAMATILWLDHEAVIDPENPGIVRAPMKAPGPREETGAEVVSFVAKYPDVPAAAAQVLLALVEHNETAAVEYAARIRSSLERSEADLAPVDERRRIHEQNQLVFQLQKEFADLPDSIVKRIVIDGGYQAERARRRLKDISGRVDSDSLAEVYEALPNMDVEMLVRELEWANGDSEAVIASMFEVSTVGLQNGEAVFSHLRKLKGVRPDGTERQRPILELDVSGASRKRAERNIRRIVERFMTQPFGYGEVRVRTSWLNPEAVPVELIKATMDDVDPHEKFVRRISGQVVSFVPRS
jgi:hypothetical protein